MVNFGGRGDIKGTQVKTALPIPRHTLPTATRLAITRCRRHQRTSRTRSPTRSVCTGSGVRDGSSRVRLSEGKGVITDSRSGCESFVLALDHLAPEGGLHVADT